MHRHLAPALREGKHAIGHLRRGVQARDHFHQLHQWHRVKKVHAHQALGVAQALRHGSNRDGRGVARKHAVRTHNGFQLLPQGAFGVHVFHNGFYHQRAALGVVQIRYGRDAC